jgi:hypothetical protein
MDCFRADGKQTQQSFTVLGKDLIELLYGCGCSLMIPSLKAAVYCCLKCREPHGAEMLRQSIFIGVVPVERGAVDKGL